MGMAKRETIYNKAVEEMTAHNARYEAGEETYFQGVNQFTDMTLEEFQALPMFGFVKPESAGPNLGTHEWNGEELAASVDWRSKGAVTPVKTRDSVALAGHSPPLVALRELGRSAL